MVNLEAPLFYSLLALFFCQPLSTFTDSEAAGVLHMCDCVHGALGRIIIGATLYQQNPDRGRQTCVCDACLINQKRQQSNFWSDAR